MKNPFLILIKMLKNLSDKAGIRHPNLAVEWGQYIVAPSQVTIYKVISKKYIPKANAKAWYVIDGSFINDLKDTWTIHQKWHAIPVNNMDAKLKTVWLAGSTCDSDDKYTAGGNYILMPKLSEDEDQYIAVLDTGAYQDSLSSHHCLLSEPVKILAQDGEAKVIRKRETAESIGKLTKTSQLISLVFHSPTQSAKFSSVFPKLAKKRQNLTATTKILSVS